MVMSGLILYLFVVRTGFEPASPAQQLGTVFINVGFLPITVLACTISPPDYVVLYRLTGLDTCMCTEFIDYEYT